MDPIALANIYTPGDVTGPARPGLANTPYSGALNTSAGNPIHTPIVGLVVAVGVVLLLEHRRLRLGRR